MRTGGDGGIRTLDRPLQAYNGLANRRLQPLGHVSVTVDMPDAGASRKRDISQYIKSAVCAETRQAPGGTVSKLRHSRPPRGRAANSRSLPARSGPISGMRNDVTVSEGIIRDSLTVRAFPIGARCRVSSGFKLALQDKTFLHFPSGEEMADSGGAKWCFNSAQRREGAPLRN
jgi:hypothetical protein